MRESIGAGSIFTIFMVFIFIFVGFICLQINRTNAFAVKNQIVQTIQASNGVDLDGCSGKKCSGAMADIVSYITNRGYRNTGNVPAKLTIDGAEAWSCFNREGSKTSNKPTFCIARIDVTPDSGIKSSGGKSYNSVCSSKKDNTSEFPVMSYYKVVVFYQLDLPVMNSIFNFTETGDTKIMYGCEVNS